MNTTGRIRTSLLAAFAAFFMAAPGRAQSIEETHALAAAANTGAKHAAVAKQYRLHAEAFEAKAAEYEKDVRQLTRASGAIVYKWPGMASKQLQDAKAKALDARRAARETRLLADHHIRLAVEAQAGAAVAGD